ncbi:ferredoxin [Streptomyces noursei]|uniref:Ferredoxin n=1 Tax=Streptomyces noursei TaxID=1971 RepID=A0A059VWY3_STRNR|nr:MULTISPECIES: ferredoxin [Streptomyces]AKA02284.1 ferredoxin [Streptomyces noursei ZPM]AIA01915.1 ferredoxin [Streptomyces noursei]EOT02255.1 hypothetical protein K530_19665 [Streptomyces noursei CCRC 11814]EXU85523.1 hypothetical protein P354_09420 [Streptomyces noursei PD-1]MCZ0975419.1 ferredoxin [Streptomyces noursei]
MRITIDSERCVGAGQCVLSAPQVFDQDEDGIVTLLAAPGPDEAAKVRIATALCPSGAITAHEG